MTSFHPGYSQDNPLVEIEEWEVPWARTRPRDSSVDPGGMIWFVGQTGNYAATLNSETGEFQQYEVPEGAHPHSILVDGYGRPWYTGNTDAHIGLIDPGSGEVRQFPTPSPQARDPHTMTFSGDGALWFTCQHGNSIGRLDTATGDVELLVPTGAGSRPYGILTAPDGMVWGRIGERWRGAYPDHAAPEQSPGSQTNAKGACEQWRIQPWDA